ncbi:hypothetical protein ACFW2V_33120 [Streptomyces sp. NPDC058947]|uniref:hypothetical protein n=1 Tax=Streptomyces sp. NPDC058947 TaxID=3346675 RepID=UPI0036995502
MPETRDVTVSAAAYARLAAAAEAEGVSVRAYLERIAEGIDPERPGQETRRPAAGSGPDRRLVALGVGNPRRGASGRT